MIWSFVVSLNDGVRGSFGLGRVIATPQMRWLSLLAASGGLVRG